MASPPSRSIALEGPCCAGKTALGRQLIDHVPPGMVFEYVRDYSDYVGGGRLLPPPVPNSLAEEEQILAEFLRIESDRTKSARRSRADLILIDRSVHTLLAHCQALQAISGLSYADLGRRVLKQSDVALWPDVVVYLDIPNEVAKARNNGKFDADSIYMDLDFNAAFRLYFLQLAELGSPRVIWLDGMLDPLSLRNFAEVRVRELLQASDAESRVT